MPLKKVAVVTDGIFPYVVGGMQKHSFYLVNYLVKNKINVILYHTASDSKAFQLDCFTPDEKKYIRSVFIEYPPAGFLPGHYLREMYAYSVEIWKHLSMESVDFIYVQGLCGMRLLEMKSRVKVPIGINMHGLEMFQQPANLRTRLEQFLFRGPVLSCLKKADVVYSLGGKLTEILLRNGIPTSKIRQIPIGVGSDWLFDSTQLQVKQPLKFLFVGRYERRKGIEELHQALLKLNGKSFEFHFVGDIPVEKRISINSVIYHGKLTDAEALKALERSMDVLVCPSFSEGMPTVILEAMASGMAIIASDVGAVAEQVRPENGILIQPGSISQIVDAMLRYLSLPPSELLAQKEASLRRIQDHFLWEKTIEKTIQSIESDIKFFEGSRPNL